MLLEPKIRASRSHPGRKVVELNIPGEVVIEGLDVRKRAVVTVTPDDDLKIVISGPLVNSMRAPRNAVTVRRKKRNGEPVLILDLKKGR